MGIIRTGSIDTGMYAACCEYLSDGSLLCGTYQLQENGEESSGNSRLGSLLNITTGTDKDSPLTLESKISTSGVLDIQVKDNIAAIMLADGTVSLLNLSTVFGVDLPSELNQAHFGLQKRQEDVSVVLQGLCLAGAWS